VEYFYPIYLIMQKIKDRRAGGRAPWLHGSWLTSSKKKRGESVYVLFTGCVVGASAYRLIAGHARAPN
jgi:hypothetical protein